MKKLLLTTLSIALLFVAKSQTNTHSLSFDNVDDFVEVPDAVSLNPTTALTIEAWIKANSWGTNVYSNYIVGKDDWTITSSGYALRCGAGGELSFNFSDGLGGWQEVISSPTMTTGVWTHVAGTFDGTTLTIYINGVPAGTTSYTGTINPSTSALNIGAVPYIVSGSRLFDGKIDQVEVWNTALNATQINQYMGCPPIGTETGIVGLWKFEEGVGTATADSTANHNNGTLMNGVAWSTDAHALSCPHAGIQEYNNSAFNVFPNPTSGKFMVTFTKPFDNGVIQLYDVLGNKCYEAIIKNASSGEINLNNISKGIYFLKINADGKQSSQKLIVE